MRCAAKPPAASVHRLQSWIIILRGGHLTHEKELAMKTYHIEKFGSPDGLMLRSHDEPAPGPDDVVVRMDASLMRRAA